MPRSRSALYVFVLLCSMLVFTGCAQLPPRDLGAPGAASRSEATGPIDTSSTRLARALAPAVQEHPDRSGVRLIESGRDAFAVRVLLAEAAERTLDVQYYIWRDDVSGRLLFDALTRAADRGVRVRLLLDDLGTNGLDDKLAELDAHPHIEVRLFNPFAQRSAKYLGFLSDFTRLNRRMHSKSFTADQQATVVGGRNVADAYFGAPTETLFVDLDVLAVGPVATQVDDEFERFWNSASAYPLSQLVPASAAPLAVTATTTPSPAAHSPVSLATQMADANLAPEALAYLQAVTESTFLTELLAQRLSLDWVPVQLVSDDPGKVLGEVNEADLLRNRMAQILGSPKTEFYLVSPYFVPTSRGYEWFADLRKKGVTVKVLTNALESTDVAAVHAGYARWRRPLLEAGVELYEIRRVHSLTQPTTQRRRGPSMDLSSGESLHAKTFSIDRTTLFVGSFNFDPRSVRLNTEIGLLIDSPRLASRLARRFDEQVALQAYQPQLGPDGRLQWLDAAGGQNGQPQVFEQEPNAGFWRNVYVLLLRLLPIDSQL